MMFDGAVNDMLGRPEISSCSIDTDQQFYYSIHCHIIGSIHGQAVGWTHSAAVNHAVAHGVYVICCSTTGCMPRHLKLYTFRQAFVYWYTAADYVQ